MISEIGDDDWARLSALLDEALELDAAELDAWLGQLAATHPASAIALRELLGEKAEMERSGFLEHAPAGRFAPATMAGQRIGTYEIEKLVGMGGMGAVWLARRCDGRYEGKAAVKLLNRALVGGPAEQRFTREGSVLAALQHPNIAHLIDAGVSAGGQPYLVLEYVEGKAIDQYCGDNRLGIRGRLRIFLDVLAAVGYAHRHLIVHRDLKPANIMVTGDGVVKLLDFGVAALIEPEAEATSSQAHTRETGSALTPEFASPEQLLGESVTTASDIYALGRVLYVLLGGSLPGGDRPAAALMRDTLERDAPRLSEAAADQATRRLLRGDLDNIVAKALKREPMARYATAEAFADDLRHYLADEPVAARPDTVGYRVGKFVRRHRGGVLSGALLALTLVFVTGFAVVQMLEAQRQRDEADAQRQRAQGFSTAITGLLSQAGPGGRPLTPEELLQRAVTQVEATYADDPEFLVQMLILLSGRYFDLQNTRLESETLARAERVARESGNPALLFTVHCNTVETDLASGRRTAARRRLEEALRLSGELGDVPPLDHAACLRARAEIARADGDLGRSIGYFEEARLALEAGGRTRGNVYGGILSGLAVFNAQAGDVLAAHAYFSMLVELDERMGREDSVPGRLSRLSLANSFLRLGQARRAYAMHREAGSERTASAPDKVLFAEVLTRIGYHDSAIAVLRDATDDVDSGGYQPFRIRVRLALADSLLEAGKLDEALQTLAEASSLVSEDPVANRRQVIEAHLLRARILTAAGRPQAAEPELEAARQHHAAGRFGAAVMAHILLVRARTQLALGRAADSAASARAAASLFEQNTLEADQSADVGEAWLARAQAESASGDAAAARQSLERAATPLRNGLGADHRLTRLAERLSRELPRS